MSILGAVGSLYMSILVVLLIIGFGMVGLKVVNYVLTIDKASVNSKNNSKTMGENKGETYKWLRIALFSFLGVMISVLILSIISSNGSVVSHM